MNKFFIACFLMFSILTRCYGHEQEYRQLNEALSETWQKLVEGHPPLEESYFGLLFKVMSSLKITPINDIDKYPSGYLYGYNYLREILYKDTVENIQQVDANWLLQVKDELGMLLSIETHTLENPTEDQKRLFGLALNFIAPLLELKGLNLLKKTPYLFQGYKSCAGVILAWPEQILTDEHIISIDRDVNKDEMLFHMYHEIGHILSKSSEVTHVTDVKQKLIPEMVEAYQGLFDMNRHYTDLGKKAFSTGLLAETDIGKTLKDHKTFWNPPVEKDVYDKTLLGRGYEVFSDIFACELLCAQNITDPIVSVIHEWGTNGYVVVEGDADKHPSAFERALYMTGFLVNQGVDVEKVFTAWQNKGTCQRIPDADVIIQDRVMTQGALDLHQAQARWKIELRKKYEIDYAAWKKTIEEQIKALGLADDLDLTKAYLVRLFKAGYKQSQKYPPYLGLPAFSRELIHAYNFLGELFNYTNVLRADEVEPGWVEYISEDLTSALDLVQEILVVS